MIRDVISIDEDLCTGCGDCVPSCHEGALQIIDGKARLISDLMCDGLGACLGSCPTGAMTIEKREAEAYNEVKVMEIMVTKGENTVRAHLKHLKDHKEFGFLKEAVTWLKSNATKADFDVQALIMEIHNYDPNKPKAHAAMNIKPMAHAGSGCPGSQERTFAPIAAEADSMVSGVSALKQWPVQLHLVNPSASFFQHADVVLAADCVAFSLGDFHSKWLKGKSLAIACPKLDTGLEVYLQKLVAMINDAEINTLTVMIMQVPCCSGLMQLAKTAQEQAARKIPLKKVVVSLEGQILSEEWV